MEKGFKIPLNIFMFLGRVKLSFRSHQINLMAWAWIKLTSVWLLFYNTNCLLAVI